MGELLRALRTRFRDLLVTALLPAHLWAGGQVGHPDQGTLVEAGPEQGVDLAALQEAREDPLRPGSSARRTELASPLDSQHPGANRPQGDRIASWVTSRELRYASQDHRGGERLYSGRIYLPTRWSRRTPLEVPLVVYVHATESQLDQIPQFNRGNEAMVGAMAAYLHNFVVAMPDLPGYGHDPSGRPHPYCHAKSLAFCVLDMIQPALGLLDPAKLRWDGRVFLLGYSAGGYGAMAAVKEWHSNPHYADLPLTAAACMAAPFHFSRTMRAMLTVGSAYQRPDIQAALLRAYHDLYPELEVFALERAVKPQLLAAKAEGLDQGSLETWLNGVDDCERICQKIKARLLGGQQQPFTVHTILNYDWVAAQLLSPRWPDTEVGRVLQENDLVGGWHPKVPMLLASSPGDECVPVSNTLALMEDWARRGCAAKVEFYPLTLLGRPMDHLSGGALALEKAFRWFKAGDYMTGPLRSRL